MSRRGNRYDNGPTESLFGSLETECVRGERLATHAEARAALFDPSFSTPNAVATPRSATSRRRSTSAGITPSRASATLRNL